ncbi:epidermal growth factor receptor kinase substrate 8-like protein 3b [Pseudoliparis swirei]|uniref:epidermal growth factor receptor kinase substrate 8-like protein 3b n=1 Tax=Pseudoliparis swirei TaxID=2059687 RepID=UPI0024BD9EA9|nr:epidermal growth factor receptor kinase substrate 8-like protein 3b [Pseudoliparis swirei]
MFGNTGPFSYSPRGFSPEDLPQRSAFKQDDFKVAPLQRNISRPSGKSIYMQRKEYSEALNKHPDNFHVRVEHLFTCELDGQEVKTVDDCLAKLKRLDAKGRLWPQQMIMEVQRGYLLLSDIETKSALDSMPLSCILQTKAVLDSCAYNSVLTVTVQERNKRIPQVFMFQCEETGAVLVKSDLDKVVRKGGDAAEPRRDQSDIRTDLENIIGQHGPGNFRQPGPRPVQQARTPPPPDHPAPQWRSRQTENMPPPHVDARQEATMYQADLHELHISSEVAVQTDTERNTDILNHVINDLEIFIDKVCAAANASALPQEAKKKNNAFKMKKKTKNNAPTFSLPLWDEYVSYLQKVKYGFNLLGQLEGTLSSPTAPDYVHIFFTSLDAILPRYPADLPPTVLSPLLTEAALQLLSQVVDPEEDLLWRSLGDSWNLPRSRWPDDDVPFYIPQFYDGWQPPAPTSMPSSLPYENSPMSPSDSQRFPPGGPREPPLYMRVIYDFTARNNQELSMMKGDVVQVVQKSKQWWLVSNARDEEGHVPQNVLEPMKSEGPMEELLRDNRGPVTLNMTSTPSEVKAWLQYKGFNKITATSLGVLTGKLLLGMTKDEIRMVCPEEGGKVFFQLQAIKSAIALASERSSLNHGRY